eukprot:9800143-Heterocapsa_arctica.AAC.1
MAVLVPTNDNVSTKRNVLKVYGMRAVSGHSSEIDQSKLATRLKPEHYDLMSAITHKTRADLLPSIFRLGIVP